MSKYGVLKWFYSETGNWMTMSSTDFDAIQSLAAEIGQSLSRDARIKFWQFTSGGGSARIDNLMVDVRVRDHVEELIDSILRRNDWNPVSNSYDYKRTA
jgi:hypothetical protein